MAKKGRELWKLVEETQGHSFVSDDMCDWPDEAVIAFCLEQLPNARRVVRAFEKISKGYELTRPAQEGDKP